ncbi:DUF397 domain-containing protein [Nocardiopsis potens]|uniref:DUF397 domain-containing protein n=1 Tax=Nocardiopsis potens TaxID=1246458 RepID=UPI000349395D|nr:DUF397 domain-containing protein [Nocardiopsis potens]
MSAIDSEHPRGARGALAPEWRTSSYSGTGGGQCVEVADLPAATLVRDSLTPDGAVLAFGRGAWAAFVAAGAKGRL